MAILLTASLVGCSPQLPFTESFRTAIPTALLASDLGITEATADNGIDGLAVNLDIAVVFDHGTVTSGELTELLEIIVEHNNLSNPHDLNILGVDGSADEPDVYVGLGAAGAELGFEKNSQRPENFTADWDDVVAFVKEHQND